MTLSEKIRWFWLTGVLPGTLFDDLDDRKRKHTRSIAPPQHARTDRHRAKKNRQHRFP